MAFDPTEKRIKQARTDPLYDKMIGQLQLNPMGAIVIDSRTPPDSEDGRLQKQVWERWQTYLGKIGRKKTLKAWFAILNAGGKLTLPCSDPREIDHEYAREQGPRNRYWDR